MVCINVSNQKHDPDPEFSVCGVERWWVETWTECLEHDSSAYFNCRVTVEHIAVYKCVSTYSADLYVDAFVQTYADMTIWYHIYFDMSYLHV